MWICRHPMRDVWRRLLGMVERRLALGAPEHVEDWVARVVQRRAEALPPADALKFLLRMEGRVSGAADRAALRMGDGVHPKHRWMRYARFFTERIRATDRVVDIGCGIGAVAWAIANETGADVTGIDIAATSIEEARRRYQHPRLRFVVGDALQGVPGGAFDVIVLSNVLEHLPNRAEFLKRLLSATGASRALIRVPMFEREWRVAARKELGLDWRMDATHETEYAAGDFADEMQAAGLSVCHQECRWGEIWAECERRGA